MMHGEYAWGMGSFGWLFMVVFWVLVLLGIVLIIKWAFGSTTGKEKPETPLDILKTRYARGEISKEEFDEKKKDIS